MSHLCPSCEAPCDCDYTARCSHLCLQLADEIAVGDTFTVKGLYLVNPDPQLNAKQLKRRRYLKNRAARKASS